MGIGGGFLGTVAVEVSFEFGDAAKGAVLDQFGEGDEVSVPAAVCTSQSLDDGLDLEIDDLLWNTASCLFCFLAMATSSSASL